MFKIPLFVFVTIVATLNLSLAETQSDSSSDENHQEKGWLDWLSKIPMLFKEQEAGGPPADAPADDAPVSSEHQENEGHQSRFFFSLFRPVASYVACNFTTQPGSTCTSCTTALTCGSSNVGRLRACRGFFPYCNLGRCSVFPGELCVNSTG